MSKVYKVITSNGKIHASFNSFRQAVNCMLSIRGYIEGEKNAWSYAVKNQGFVGDFEAWMHMYDDERKEYEIGAIGVGSV